MWGECRGAVCVIRSERWYRRWATERGRQSEGVKDHEDSEDGAGIETLKSYMVEWEKHLKRSQLGRYACRGELAESGPRRRIRLGDLEGARTGKTDETEQEPADWTDSTTRPASC
jgi:hypothetical protein